MNDTLTSLMPSKFFKTEEFDTDGQDLVIAGIESDQAKNANGMEPVSVLKFHGHDKGLILKSTNISTLQELFGNSRSALVGKTINVYKDPTVTYGGARRGGLRIRRAANPSRNGSGAATETTVKVTAAPSAGSVTTMDLTKEFIRLGFDRDQAKAFIGLNVTGKNDPKQLTEQELATAVSAARAL
jgi:hypothetical protein